MVEEEFEEEAFRDRIATVDEDGARKWIFPKKPSGKLFNYRKIVSYVLLVMLFAAPHIKIGGEPLLMFNVLERKFVIFGKIFWPQDLYLFAIAFVIGVIFVILFTIVFGRLFCGWVCPQTIFMEMVFRRIEYWIEGDWTHQKKLAAAPWNADKIKKRLLKHSVFWIISFLIANTFLAYIIGADGLWEIQTGKFSEHIGGFVSIVIFTTIFYLVFTRLREQVCTTICPYGRLQGVLLDPDSMVVAYDHKRGEGKEGRARFRKKEDRSASGKGDCIDCNQCVNVCPTGIDIRNGTQLECVNCTACIDECDHMMEAVGLEKGLIRFVSENGIEEGKHFEWTRKVKAYTVLLIGLLAVLVILLMTRSDFQTTVLRQRGTTYHVTKEGDIGNIFEINLTNKTFDVKLKTEDPDAKIKMVTKLIRLKEQGHIKDRFVISMPLKRLEGGKMDIEIVVYGNGKEIERVRTKLIGPII